MRGQFLPAAALALAALLALPGAVARPDVTVLDNDGGDVPAFKGLDIVSVAIHEGADYPGLMFIIKVADVTDMPPTTKSVIVRAEIGEVSADWPMRIHAVDVPVELPITPSGVPCETTCALDVKNGAFLIGAPYVGGEFPFKVGDVLKNIRVHSYTGDGLGLALDVIPGDHPPQLNDYPDGPSYLVQGPEEAIAVPPTPMPAPEANATATNVTTNSSQSSDMALASAPEPVAPETPANAAAASSRTLPAPTTAIALAGVSVAAMALARRRTKP